MPTFFLDGEELAYREGDTVLEAALAAGRHIPHLCWHPELEPHSSCRLCVVLIGGRAFAACTQPAMPGQKVEHATADLAEMRKALLQMLFVEGNHTCPACEKSGECRLQATAYEAGMQDSHFAHQFPVRARDFSHPDVFLDRDRCIRCELCVRASRTLDGKNVFAITGRGLAWTLSVNSPSGLLADSAIAAGDAAVRLCPTGALMPKRVGFARPVGERTYDRERLSVIEVRDYQHRRGDRG
jgi:[NiFe] hydrogenase diaphorase moiety small subunit